MTTPQTPTQTPRTDEEFNFVIALQVATARVNESVLFRQFIDGTPLSNDIAVWMAQAYIEGADFARTLERELSEAKAQLRHHQEVTGAICLPTDVPISYAELKVQLAAVTKERDGYKVEYESRAIWIAQMNAILGYNNEDGFHSEPAPHAIAKNLVSERDTLAAEVDRWRTRAESFEAGWADTTDKYTSAINAAHPVKTDNHALYLVAIAMVNNRRGKYELVNIVNWLLSENAELRKVGDEINKICNGKFLSAEEHAIRAAWDKLTQENKTL